MKFLKRLLSKEKHEVTVIYPDRIFHYSIKYPPDGKFEDERGAVYYLDPRRTVHVFIGGYANEIDTVKFHKSAEKYEFEPSETFKVAMEARIRKAIYGLDKDSEWINYILIGGVLVAIALLVWILKDLHGVMEGMKLIGVIK